MIDWGFVIAGIVWVIFGNWLGYRWCQRDRRKKRDWNALRHDDFHLNKAFIEGCPKCWKRLDRIASVYEDKYDERQALRVLRIYAKMGMTAKAFGAASNDMFGKALTTNFKEEE